MFTTSSEVEARFWAKVRKTEACWLWTARTDKKGYGHFKLAGNTVQAHRFAWFLKHGEAPPSDHVVMHTCDRPSCVRHLRLGTVQQNNADCRRKGRMAVGDKNGARKHPERLPRGARHGQAKLSTEQVVEIRRKWVPGTMGVLAAEYGVSRTQIWNIVHYRKWALAPST